jgi:hypothetical protein
MRAPRPAASASNAPRKPSPPNVPALSATSECIEAWYDPRRRHTSIDDRSPVDYERLYIAATDAA